MTETIEQEFADRFRSSTETYLDRIQECASLVPELLDRYRTGGDYRGLCERIRALESDCDRINRDLSGLVTNTTPEELGLLNARLHFNSPSLLELFQTLDEIPNVAEQVTEDLLTMQPARVDRIFQQFEAMAEHATSAIAALSAAVGTFVDLLSTRSDSGIIDEEIETIRNTESTCDGLRNDVIADVFADEEVSRPLVYREIAFGLDELVDAMEDSIDQLVVLASNGPWIVTESDRT